MLGRLAHQSPRCSPATRISASPTAWGSRPRKSLRNGRSRARTQDAFALASHQKALAAQAAGEFDERDLALSRSSEHVPISPPSEIVHARARVRPGRRPARGHERRGARQAAAGVRRQGLGHGGQQLADVRRRGRVDPRERARAEGARARRRSRAGSASRSRACRRRSWASVRSRRFPRCCKQTGICAGRSSTGSSSTRRSRRKASR